MTDDLKLLKGSDIKISEKIMLRHPTLSEIADMGEAEYYSFVSTLCATPSDYKSILYDEFNTDYETVGEFEFFITLFRSFGDKDLSIILPGINTQNFDVAYDHETDEICLLDEKNDIVITEAVYIELVDYLRKFHGFEKHVDKAGNATTKKYLIDRARKELKRKKKKEASVLAPLVSSMVNCEQFKYDHYTVWDLNIYQFMDSVKRIQKIKSADKILQGIYTGNVDSKKISRETYNWIGTLD